MSFLLKVFLLCINLGLIIAIKAGIDKLRIDEGKRIYHGVEVLIAIAEGALVTWLIGASWQTVPFQTSCFWLFFDGNLSRLRELPFFYVGSSWIDNAYKFLFGKKADVAMAISKVAFLIASIVFMLKGV